jgi:hypothetical protein
MSIASASRSVESAPVVPGNGASTRTAAIPIMIPDDMLYEVVDGKSGKNSTAAI